MQFWPLFDENAKCVYTPGGRVENRKWVYIDALQPESTEYVVGLRIFRGYGGLIRLWTRKRPKWHTQTGLTNRKWKVTKRTSGMCCQPTRATIKHDTTQQVHNLGPRARTNRPHPSRFRISTFIRSKWFGENEKAQKPNTSPQYAPEMGTECI